MIAGEPVSDGVPVREQRTRKMMKRMKNPRAFSQYCGTP